MSSDQFHPANCLGYELAGGNILIKYQIENSVVFADIPEEAIEDAYRSKLRGEEIFIQRQEYFCAMIGAFLAKEYSSENLANRDTIEFSEGTVRAALNLGSSR